MKKLGFIDYCLDEWHANNYPAMIADYNSKNGAEYRVAYAWAEENSPAGRLTTDEWCEKFGAERCETIEELCEKSDHVIILAPSDPDKHLSYAERVFGCGTSPYIDKTFAPDFKTAEKIFRLAGENNVKFFSSSALRYADELSAFNGDAQAAFITGGGSNLEEYIIHQIEMAVKCLGIGAESVVYSRYADEERAEVFYGNGKHAGLLFAPAMPFTASVADRGGKSAYCRINSKFFDNLIADIFRFFETGKPSFDPAETLEVMKIRDALISGKSLPGKVIPI